MQSRSSVFEFPAKKNLIRRERLARETDAVMPWAELNARIEPFYPQGSRRGRPPVVPTRRRVYVVQQWLHLSDKGIEDAVYDNEAIHGFIGIDMASESEPAAAALPKFRRPLETHGLTKAIVEASNADPAAEGRPLRGGRAGDVAIIGAPSSTKNDCGTRDPEIRREFAPARIPIGNGRLDRSVNRMDGRTRIVQGFDKERGARLFFVPRARAQAAGRSAARPSKSAD